MSTVREWCPYCREHYSDESESAAQHFIAVFCAPGEEADR